MPESRRAFGDSVVLVIEGDLTAQSVDAIVNAANEYLKHGAGVAGAIVRAGGHSIQDESDRWVREHGPIGGGNAAVTGAGRLDARWVIHTVGPRHEPGQDNEGLLRSAICAALDAAHRIGARSVAMPAISAGIFGYPLWEATATIAGEVWRWLGAHPDAIDEVRLVGYGDAAVDAFAAGLADA